jgi:hypothetical protein
VTPSVPAGRSAMLVASWLVFGLFMTELDLLGETSIIVTLVITLVERRARSSQGKPTQPR